jgi:HAD-superfamily hydrolase, subfamily IIB
VGASADDGVAHALLELVRATKAGETPRFMMEN